MSMRPVCSPVSTSVSGSVTERQTERLHGSVADAIALRYPDLAPFKSSRRFTGTFDISLAKPPSAKPKLTKPGLVQASAHLRILGCADTVDLVERLEQQRQPVHVHIGIDLGKTRRA